MNATTIVEVSCAPAPEWADTPPFQPSSSPSTGETVGGVRHLLVDDQVKAGDGPQVALTRRVHEVVSSDSLGAVASVDMVFDPTFERACIHFVRIIRKGKTRDLPLADAFEIFRREPDLERAKFDGRLTAHMIIPDLRVGDIIDYCFSIRGENPAFCGLVAHAPNFQWSVAVENVRFRLLTPPDWIFNIRNWGPDVTFREERGRFTDRMWTAQGVEAFRYEPGSPPDWTGHSRAVIAQATTWPQIVEMFREAYGPPPALPEDLEAMADEIARQNLLPEDRIAPALRLVQSEIRYLAISIGEGGLLPRRISDIWACRFGDCKDASRLLVALLNRLGVDAAPALANTMIGYGLAEYPPAAIAFNHCIVRVRLGEQTVWLDPTRSPQGGRLAALVQARFGWALPLVAGSQLEAMGEDELATVCELEHDVHFGEQARSSARLEVRSTLRSWRADDLRRRIANDGQHTVARAFREFYENRFGPLTEVSPAKISDRFDDNEMETLELYDILEPWRLTEDGRTLSFTTADEVIGPEFPIPRLPDRRAPIHLGWPRRMTQLTTLFLPRTWNVNGYDDAWKVGVVEATASLKQDEAGRTAWLKTSVTFSGRVLPADDARSYFELADRSRASALVTLTHAAANGDFVAASSPPRRKPWEPPTRRAPGKVSVLSWIWRVVWMLIVLSMIGRALGGG